MLYFYMVVSVALLTLNGNNSIFQNEESPIKIP